MANSTYILQIFVMELVLLSHIHGVKSYIRGPPGDTEYRSDTTTRLSYLTVLELLAPEKKITAQETQASASRPNLPRRHLQTYEELEEQVTTRPISHNLQDLYRMMDSFESHDPQNIAHKTQNSPQEDYIVKLISITLQALQNEFLSIHERMWSLTLLDALQSYLPCEKLIGIRTNVAEGPVFRGALELHLTRGLDIDLLSISQEILLDPCTQRERQHALGESLTRSHILSDLKDYMQHSPDYKLTPSLTRLHDILIQASFPIQDKDNIDHILTCSAKLYINPEYMNHTITFISFQRMLNHFMTYDQNLMKLISIELLSLPSGFQKHKMFMMSSVSTDISTLLAKRRDEYLENTFKPFRDEEQVELTHFQHVVNSLKAQESAIQNFNVSEYDIPDSHIQEYLMDTHSLLHILHRCSLYQNPEVSEYLESDLTWIGNRLTFKSEESPDVLPVDKLISSSEPRGIIQERDSAVQQEALQDKSHTELINFVPIPEVSSLQETKLPLKSVPVRVIAQDEKLDLKLKQTQEKSSCSPSTPQSKRHSSEERRAQCPTCLDEFKVGHRVIKLQCHDNIPHIFHGRCLWPWYLRKKTCPFCRKRISYAANDFSHVFWS